ncbi:MAG TPA: TetR family transcriptional regulator [Solirubrobacteraceae bacterium]|nr:TetR family transcriptional regulator [Solirubrobacteraceae bacterium]
MSNAGQSNGSSKKAQAPQRQLAVGGGGSARALEERVRLAPLLRDEDRGRLPAPLRLRSGRSTRAAWGYQRVRLFLAMVRAVHEHGYRDASVDELCRLAGVSTRTLYERFPGGKQACFLAIFDLVTDVAARRVFRARESELAWRERLEMIVGAFARQVAEEPEAAQLALVDSFVAGEAARAEIDQIRARFEAFVAACFDEAPDDIGLEPLIVKAIVAGIAHLARSMLIAGRASELPDEVPTIVRWMLSYRADAARPVVLPGSLAIAPDQQGPVASSCAAQLEALGTRGRIMAAAVRIAAREGAGALAGERVAKAAEVSRWTVARHFASIEECLLTAIEALVEAELAAIARAAAAHSDWGQSVCAATVRMLARVASDEEYARVAYVEVMALGAPGMRLRDRLLADAGRIFARSMPAQARLPASAAAASAGAVWGLIFQASERGEAHKLVDYAGLFSFLVLAPTLGADAALRSIAPAHGSDARS